MNRTCRRSAAIVPTRMSRDTRTGNPGRSRRDGEIPRSADDAPPRCAGDLVPTRDRTDGDRARLIGDCGLHTLADRPGQAEIGFTLALEQQGKGYATEAVNCLLDYVFGTLEKHRVIAVTDTRNGPASRLLERVGMRREGHFIENVWFKGEWGDEYQYAMLEREWRALRPTGGPGRPATT